MVKNTNYKLALLHLLYLITICDNEIEESEVSYLGEILRAERIDEEQFVEFKKSLNNKSEKDIFYEGITLMNQFDDDLKTRAFKILFKMANVDKRLHAREARFLLYTSKYIKVDMTKAIDNYQNQSVGKSS